MIHIMGNLMKAHIPEIVRLIEAFFHSHLPACMDLVESLALKLTFPDFNTVLREVLPTILQVLHEEQFELDNSLEGIGLGQAGSRISGLNFSMGSSLFGRGASAGLNGRGNLINEEDQGISSISSPRLGVSSGLLQAGRNLDSPERSGSLLKTRVILQSCVNLSDVLGDQHKRTVVPSVLHVLDFQGPAFVDVRRQALCTAMYLTDDCMLHEYANQLLLPLMRICSEPENASDSKSNTSGALRLRSAAVVALSCLCCRLGTSYIPYIIPVRRNLNNLVVSLRQSRGDANLVNILVRQLAEYENLVFRLLEHKPLPIEPTDAQSIRIEVSDRLRARAQAVRSAPERYLPPSLSTLEQVGGLLILKRSFL